MNTNMNDISGFDAMTEEVRQVYAERDRLRDENRTYREILDEIKEIFKMGSVWTYGEIPGFVRTSHDWLCEKREEDEEQAKQFTEDICAALGVRSDMSTRKSILGEISKLRKEHENHKCTVKKQEDFTEEAASILCVHPGDLSLSDVLAALHKLKREEKLDDMNSSIIADLREERDKLQQSYHNELGRRKTAERYISDTFQRAAKELGMTCIPDGIDTLCDEIADLRNYRNRISCPKEFWEAMCDIMEMDPTDATPSDVIAKTKETKQRLISLLALNPDTTTWTDIYDGIKAEQKDHCDLISESYKMKNKLEELEKDVKNGDLLIAKQLEQDKKALKRELDHADERRRHWVRRYKSEHERANSCDKLYKKYKALYDADAPRREKLSDDMQTYRSSYEAIKNEAIKKRSLMNTVAQIVGTVGMPDDVTMAGVLNVKKKANHWDILVENYGEGTMRSLLENIGIDVSGDKGNGLFK